MDLRWKQLVIASGLVSGLTAGLSACADPEGIADPGDITDPDVIADPASPADLLDPSLAPHSERAGIGLSEPQPPANTLIVVDPRRSLAVTDQSILAPFSLNAVMNQLVAQNGGTGFTSSQLFRQLWDTQNPAPGQPDLAGGAHCTDNGGTLNGFPYPCRTTEGQQAPPMALINPSSYFPIGLFNRFDLAPADGANCGEYRIVYAKNTASSGRNFIIFEAVLPNPRTDLKLEGCRPVAQFWANLSTNSSASSRSAALKSFYFTGLAGFSPVIHMNNYGNNSTGAGQVRTNLFMQPL